MLIHDLEDLLYAAERRGDEEGWETQTDDLIRAFKFLWERASADVRKELLATMQPYFDEVVPHDVDTRDGDEDEKPVVAENFQECDECRVKPGSPVLCGDCLTRREELFRTGKCRPPKECSAEAKAAAARLDARLAAFTPGATRKPTCT